MKKTNLALTLAVLTVLAVPSGALPQKWLHNPLQLRSDNQAIHVKVLVLNYDPTVPSKGDRKLRELFNWNDPHKLATEYQKCLEQASGGAVKFSVVEWRDLNEIYAQMDGYRYTPDEYYKNRVAGTGWHDGKGPDYPGLLKKQKVQKLIDDGKIDEVWIFSDHFFGLWEASMAGPGAFFINGGVYPDFPSKRRFAIYGFNYERGVAEMLHDTAHRTEATLNRFLGAWNLKEPKSDWDLFSANVSQSNGSAGVGTCHFPANAKGDYDYGNPAIVKSWALDFLNYPNLRCRDRQSAKTSVSCDTWKVSGDMQKDYFMFYFGLLPRASGKTAQFENNWWKYIYSFNNYK